MNKNYILMVLIIMIIVSIGIISKNFTGLTVYEESLTLLPIEAYDNQNNNQISPDDGNLDGTLDQPNNDGRWLDKNDDFVKVVKWDKSLPTNAIIKNVILKCKINNMQKDNFNVKISYFDNSWIDACSELVSSNSVYECNLYNKGVNSIPKLNNLNAKCSMQKNKGPGKISVDAMWLEVTYQPAVIITTTSTITTSTTITTTTTSSTTSTILITTTTQPTTSSTTSTTTSSTTTLLQNATTTTLQGSGGGSSGGSSSGSSNSVTESESIDMSQFVHSTIPTTSEITETTTEAALVEIPETPTTLIEEKPNTETAPVGQVVYGNLRRPELVRIIIVSTVAILVGAYYLARWRLKRKQNIIPPSTI